MDTIKFEGGNLMPRKFKGHTILGAILGDYIGSIYEFNNIKTKDFNLIGDRCRFTDDTILTIAVFSAIRKYLHPEDSSNDSKPLKDYVAEELLTFAKLYPYAGYGNRFTQWILDHKHRPYESAGNGAAMRISPIAYFFDDWEDIYNATMEITDVTHNSKQGEKAALCIASLIKMAFEGKSKDIIKESASTYYDIDFKLDDIRESYKFSELSKDTVPQAIVAFLESTGYEDAIRNAISIGGDSDTIACITGALAGAYYGVPNELLIHLESVLKSKYCILYDIVKDLFD